MNNTETALEQPGHGRADVGHHECWSDDSMELGCLSPSDDKAPVGISNTIRAAVLIRAVPGDKNRLGDSVPAALHSVPLQ